MATTNFQSGTVIASAWLNDVNSAVYTTIPKLTTPSVLNYTGTGTTTLYTVTGSVTNVYINGIYQNKNSYSISGNTLTFTQAPPYTSLIEVNYV